MAFRPFKKVYVCVRGGRVGGGVGGVWGGQVGGRMGRENSGGFVIYCNREVSGQGHEEKRGAEKA